MKQRQLKQPAGPAPGSPALRPVSAPTTWGTRQRMAAHLSHLDQGSLDHLLDKVLRMGSAPPFIAKFHPQPDWLWRQWRGTVLQQCWVPACAMMIVSVGPIVVMEPVRHRHSKPRATAAGRLTYPPTGVHRSSLPS